MVCPTHTPRVDPGGGALLESLSWCQPLLELLSLAQTVSDLQVEGGSIHGVRIQMSVVVQTGGKVTCRNSMTARSLFGVSVLCSRPSSSRYRGVNPSSCRYRGVNPSSCRYRGVNPSSSHYRGASSSSSHYRGASSSSSRYRGSNRGSAPSSSRYRGANPVV